MATSETQLTGYRKEADIALDLMKVIVQTVGIPEVSSGAEDQRKKLFELYDQCKNAVRS
ncbi:MAG: hypothetical protein WA005_08425 [Candidatus Binataceae bacterium]